MGRILTVLHNNIKKYWDSVGKNFSQVGHNMDLSLYLLPPNISAFHLFLLLLLSPWGSSKAQNTEERLRDSSLRVWITCKLGTTCLWNHSSIPDSIPEQPLFQFRCCYGVK